MNNVQEEWLPSEYYQEGMHSTSVFFSLIGIPTTVGSIVSNVSSFAALAFFIFCGFFVLAPDQTLRMGKIRRALKRSWIYFAILFVIYFVLSLIYLAYFGTLNQLASPEFLRLRNLFNFLVLNIWPLPVGSGIWFIQSLAYAYLFFYVAEKSKLSKFYLPIFIFLVAFMLLSGEFAKVVGFPYFGYPYIPGGFLTKAIPYMLLGMFLRKIVDRLARIKWSVYLIAFFSGAAVTVGEYFLLSYLGLLVYTGNTIGHAIMAISFCCMALTKPDFVDNFFGELGESYALRMYALCQPFDFLLWLVLQQISPETFLQINAYRSFIALAVCFLLTFLISFFKFEINEGRKQNSQT